MVTIKKLYFSYNKQHRLFEETNAHQLVIFPEFCGTRNFSLVLVIRPYPGPDESSPTSHSTRFSLSKI